MARPRVELTAFVRRVARPPVREWRFWLDLAMVVAVAAVHLLMDHGDVGDGQVLPIGFPVVLFVIPVGIAALQYGLVGSSATAAVATLLWLPDLFEQITPAHLGSDLVALALVNAVAVFAGQRVDRERAALDRASRSELRYRQLFDANSAPIMVLDRADRVSGVNAAATTLFGAGAVGQGVPDALGTGRASGEIDGSIVRLADGRDYRVDRVTLAGTDGDAASQVILEDVTEEMRESRYAHLVVRADENQRRKLSRELHDEPLQLFLHLARVLERFGDAAGAPSEALQDAMGEARHQALDAAARLRVIARELRPPALDQFGLAGAVSSLAADAEDDSGITVDLEVTGSEPALPDEVELGAFRIVQEAVRNTLVHSGARRLKVQVEFRARTLRLRIADDGRGFAPQSLAGDAGGGTFGLVGMRERAHLLGGSLKVASSPGNGTVVDATLPLAGPPDGGGSRHARQARHNKGVHAS